MDHCHLKLLTGQHDLKVALKCTSSHIFCLLLCTQNVLKILSAFSHHAKANNTHIIWIHLEDWCSVATGDTLWVGGNGAVIILKLQDREAIRWRPVGGGAEPQGMSIFRTRMEAGILMCTCTWAVCVCVCMRVYLHARAHKCVCGSPISIDHSPYSIDSSGNSHQNDNP